MLVSHRQVPVPLHIEQPFFPQQGRLLEPPQYMH